MTKSINKKYFYISLFFLALFIIVLLLFKTNLTYSLDFLISNNSYDLINTFTYNFSKVISAIGSVYGVLIIVLVLSFYLYLNNYFKEIKLLYFLVSLDLIIVYSLKHVIGRLRPDNLYLTTLSFPSGHATMGVVLFGFIFWFFWNKNKFISYLSLLFLSLIGLSRIIINIHWFTDVLAGYFLGFSILFFGIYLYYSNLYFFKNEKKKKI